jgi:hypothetical protein
MLFKLMQGAFIVLVLVCCGCQEREAGGPSGLYEGQKGGEVRPTIMVYYFHRTARCPTCIAIELKAHQVIIENFNNQIAEGRLIWMPINLDEPGGEEFQKEFDIGISTLVVAKIADGNHIGYKKLDRVWTLLNDREGFSKYVIDEIDEHLNDK